MREQLLYVNEDKLKWALIFDLIPLALMKFVYNPMLITLLFYDEKELNQRFGENYKDYRKKVPFHISEYKRHTEREN